MNILESHIEGAQCYAPDERAQIYRAIIEYLYYGYEPDYLQGPAEGYFIAIKPNLDNHIRRVESGRKGGQAKAKQTPSKPCSKRQANPVANAKQKAKQNGSDIDIDIDSDIEGEKPSKETRHKHGQYSNVLLSDSDLEKLKSEFPTDWQERIERLSGYIASTGKSYKNHLATIRNWARRDGNVPERPKERRKLATVEEIMAEHGLSRDVAQKAFDLDDDHYAYGWR